MKRNCHGISFFLLVLAVVLSNISVAETTDFLTHSTLGKVYVDENGELRGLKHGGRRAFNVEVVREIMLIVRHPVQFQIMPFKRGQVELKKKRKALFNIARTKLREKLYKWVGPLQVDNVYFFMNRCIKHRLSPTLSKLKKFRGFAFFGERHSTKTCLNKDLRMFMTSTPRLLA
jgi:polar amino acid transport system substrate-binding protein